MSEESLVEIESPVESPERNRFRQFRRMSLTWPVLAAGGLVLLLVAVGVVLALTQEEPARALVIPVRGEMQAVVVVWPEPVDVVAARLFLAGGGEVESSTPPGVREALLFFVGAGERPERVEVVLASGRRVVVPAGR